MKRCLFVDADTVIIGLLRESGKSHIDLDQIDEFRSYAQHAIKTGTFLSEYSNIVVDLNPNAVMRAVHIHSQILDLEGERIYLTGSHSELPSLEKADPRLLEMNHDFVMKKGESR